MEAEITTFAHAHRGKNLMNRLKKKTNEYISRTLSNDETKTNQLVFHLF